jgi:hypothetical protein
LLGLGQTSETATGMAELLVELLVDMSELAVIGIDPNP